MDNMISTMVGSVKLLRVLEAGGRGAAGRVVLVGIPCRGVLCKAGRVDLIQVFKGPSEPQSRLFVLKGFSV